ncbi:MAG TPA: hypothetical protein VFO66_00295 [Gemmatimonadaceae bacterium]|jgi:uncharacterized coiled-coil DUF342 family protein|nr:hypothetical protein [Gemmatimonadaceae bacterium]HEU5173206.1 hypothetical protein [Gemmatimonadaceae bacterium]
MDDPRELDAFRDHAAALAAQIAAAEAAGDEVPDEARMMLASLRELARAVEGLRTTLDAQANATPQDPLQEED